MKKISRILGILLTSLLFIFFLSFPAQAVYLESGNMIDLPKDKDIDESVFVSGNSITVDSNIKGDLLCAGKDVFVNGNIAGDILCAAQSVTVNGSVDGNIRIVAQYIEINGIVTRNLYALSQSLSLSKFSSIQGDIFFGVQNVDLRGSLGRDLLGAGDKISITGSLLRDAKIAATKISVTDPAKIGGNFEYYIDEMGTASVSARNVKGEIIKHDIVRQMPEKKTTEVKSSALVFGKIYSIITTIVLGLALLYFLRKGIEDRVGIIASKPFVTTLIGFAVLILTPLVFILLLITIIGVPLAFVLIFEYILSIITATVYSSIFLGQWFIKSVIKNKKESHVWSLVAGATIIGVLMMIPFFGFFVGCISLSLGLGAIFVSYLPKK